MQSMTVWRRSELRLTVPVVPRDRWFICWVSGAITLEGWRDKLGSMAAAGVITAPWGRQQGRTGDWPGYRHCCASWTKCYIQYHMTNNWRDQWNKHKTLFMKFGSRRWIWGDGRAKKTESGEMRRWEAMEKRKGNQSRMKDKEAMTLCSN